MQSKPPRHRTIVVRAPQLSRAEDGRSRVVADVDGVMLLVEADAPLEPVGDAFLSAFLLQAARDGGALEIEAEVDRRLLDAVPAINAIARRYWNFPGAEIRARGTTDRRPRGGTAMFFTCGVDSFHTLLRRRDEVERLIFVRGLNIDLIGPGAESRFAAVRAGVEAVAREIDRPVVFASTDLRRHASFARIGWDASYLAALAAIGHLMGPVVSRLLVASSDMRSKWASTPELDPLWSSAAVEIVNDGADSFRLEKARAIADSPLVHRHLKVCYQARGAALNCGRCEKCVRTQAQFAAVGALGRLSTFPPSAPLPELIDGISWITWNSVPHWERIRDAIGDASIAAAITRLLARRPSAVDRIRARMPWLRRYALGRALRRVGKRLLAGERAGG